MKHQACVQYGTSSRNRKVENGTGYDPVFMRERDNDDDEWANSHYVVDNVCPVESQKYCISLYLNVFRGKKGIQLSNRTDQEGQEKHESNRSDWGDIRVLGRYENCSSFPQYPSNFGHEDCEGGWGDGYVMLVLVADEYAGNNQ